MTENTEQGMREPEIKIIPAGYAWGYGEISFLGDLETLARHPQKNEICKCFSCGEMFSPKFSNYHTQNTTSTFTFCSRACGLTNARTLRGKK